MALNAKNIKGNSERIEQPNIEPGTYPARLVQILDLGLQPQRPYKGQEKAPAQEIMLTYELVDTFMVDKEGNEVPDKPRWISETLPFFGLYADKAKSTQRYNTLDPSGDFEGDFAKAIGQAINVTIVNNAGKDGKIYDNIGTISPMRPKDADKCPELVNDVKVFDADAPDMDVFNSLPEWIRDKIKGNLNFAGSVLEAALEGAPADAVEDKPKRAKAVPKIEEDVVDNNPY